MVTEVPLTYKQPGFLFLIRSPCYHTGTEGRFIQGVTMMGMGFSMFGPPLISLLAGIAILIWPRLLNYIVAFYLIGFGLIGIIGGLSMGAM